MAGNPWYIAPDRLAEQLRELSRQLAIERHEPVRLRGIVSVDKRLFEELMEVLEQTVPTLDYLAQRDKGQMKLIAELRAMLPETRLDE